MSDYTRIENAIAYIVKQKNKQLSLEAIATQVNLSPFHFQRLFSRWAGVSPNRFMQFLTVEHAKQLLTNPVSLLEVSEAIGLSSPSRLYDSFINIEAITPGDFKRQGQGLTINYGTDKTPFGNGFIASTNKGICRFSFIDNPEAINNELNELEKSWPNAKLVKNQNLAKQLIATMFTQQRHPDRPISLLVSGTNFQINVWKALLRIPPGVIMSYQQVAQSLGYPKSARAVGTAIGKNPIGFLIPCHRVIQQSGHVGNYHWGSLRKQALIAWESAQKSTQEPGKQDEQL